MPYLTGLIHDGTGILRTGKGVLTGAEILESAKAALSLPIDLSRVNHTLMDLSKVTSFKITDEETAKIVQVASHNVFEQNHRYYIAIAAPDDSVFKACQVFRAMEQNLGTTLQIFRSLADAMAWLQQSLPKG